MPIFRRLASLPVLISLVVATPHIAIAQDLDPAQLAELSRTISASMYARGLVDEYKGLTRDSIELTSVDTTLLIETAEATNALAFDFTVPDKQKRTKNPAAAELCRICDIAEQMAEYQHRQKE